ncbi:O-methyltransferase [Raineya orbicola]|jgi:predicted O-methyltransferase YrrM|uniref:Putative O-methyltransferase n=1 Tax=Raineya orbicola TaxID=2016530 RepID=A0A2N3IKK5_9BACT|nr:O-methyltransferase [Raineya orbicola]PKQ70869.1 putative O-methyltransferase [Raineya orbicola]
MELLSEAIQKYAETHTSSENAVLRELHRQTHLKVLMPRMLSGHLQGRFLAMISQMLAPQRILEIGTYTGYSALCLAEGLQENGKLITIDKNEELEDFAKKFFAKAGLEKKIEMLIGNALEIIPTLQETWDLVFIDADKLNYAKYYEMVLPQVRKGGWIIADNVLWSGKVADTKFIDKDTEALRAFNELVQNDARVENLLLPLRDGLMIARKL